MYFDFKSYSSKSFLPQSELSRFVFLSSNRKRRSKNEHTEIDSPTITTPGHTQELATIQLEVSSPIDDQKEDIDSSLSKKGIILLEDEFTYKGITDFAKKQVLDLASSGVSDIEIYINSGGGDLMSFMSLHDSILLVQKANDCLVSTIVNGIAASAAAIVLQAGAVRYATTNSRVMIHEVSFGFEGKTTNFKHEFESIKKFEKTAFGIWASKMGISIKELESRIGNRDLYFSAKEAKKNNLIDIII